MKFRTASKIQQGSLLKHLASREIPSQARVTVESISMEATHGTNRDTFYWTMG
jgi:hypothetical protein